MLVAELVLTLCDLMDGSLCPWNSSGKNTGVGCQSLLQEIFPTQGLNPCLLHCRQILYHLSHHGSPPNSVVTFERLPFDAPGLLSSFRANVWTQVRQSHSTVDIGRAHQRPLMDAACHPYGLGHWWFYLLLLCGDQLFCSSSLWTQWFVSSPSCLFH